MIYCPVKYFCSLASWREEGYFASKTIGYVLVDADFLRRMQYLRLFIWQHCKSLTVATNSCCKRLVVLLE